MTVEPMRPGDFERVREIARLGRQSVDVGLEAARGARVWVARDGRDVLGFMLDKPTGGALHLMNLATHPDHRRRGVGKTLLRHALSRAPTVRLEVRRSNLAAIELYRAHGFSTVGLRPGYYGDDDAVEMVARRAPRVQWLGVVESFAPTKTLNDVIPEVRPKFEALIAQATALGMKPSIRSAGRTCAQQAEQVKLGYSAAELCRGMHVLGHAVDLDLSPNTCATYTKLGEWWEGQGGKWGGRWKNMFGFGECGDSGHFMYGFDGAQAVPTSVCPSGATLDQCVQIRNDYLTKAFNQSPALGSGGSRMGIFSGLLIVGVAAAILYATVNVKPGGRRLQANPRIKQAVLKDIAQNVYMGARENAFQTVREHGSKSGDEHPKFQEWTDATAEGILVDALPGRDYDSYGAPRPLTEKEVNEVAKILREEYHLDVRGY